MNTLDRVYLTGITLLMMFVLWFAFTLAARAEEQPSFDNAGEAEELKPTVPPYLEGGKITLETKAGVSKTTSSEYALVLRKNLSKYKKCPASCLAEAKKACMKEVQPTKCEENVIEKIVDRYVEPEPVPEKPIAYNRMILHLGTGYNGVEAVPLDETGKLIVQQKAVPVIGATYMRFTDSGFSYGLTAFSNNSFTGSVGLDF